MARPARVRIRSRKPWVLARRRLFGWKVRLLTAAPQDRVPVGITGGSVRSGLWHLRWFVNRWPGRAHPGHSNTPRYGTPLNTGKPGCGRSGRCALGPEPANSALDSASSGNYHLRGFQKRCDTPILGFFPVLGCLARGCRGSVRRSVPIGSQIHLGSIPARVMRSHLPTGCG